MFDKQYLSSVFVSCGVIAFMFCMFQSLSTLLVSFFSVPFVDERMSSGFAESIRGITETIANVNPISMFVLFGCLILGPVVIFAAMFVQSLRDGKKTGVYEFHIPDIFSALVLLCSAALYPVITSTTYICTVVHVINIESIPDVFTSYGNLLCTPLAIDVIAVLIFLGICIAITVIECRQKKSEQFVPLTDAGVIDDKHE